MGCAGDVPAAGGTGQGVQGWGSHPARCFGGDFAERRGATWPCGGLDACGFNGFGIWEMEV